MDAGNGHADRAERGQGHVQGLRYEQGFHMASQGANVSDHAVDHVEARGGVHPGVGADDEPRQGATDEDHDPGAQVGFG